MASALTAKAAVPAEAPSEPEPQAAPGQLKVLSRTLKVVTASRVELHNISDRVRAHVRASGIKAGFLILSSLHTTTALFMNEFQAALMADLTEFLEQLVPQDAGQLHNCEDSSDCENKNATAHLRATVLGHNVTVPIEGGDVRLGQWQSILFAELDGPRNRTVTAHLIGI